jgi:S1-C subfamily serine protease
VDAERGLVVVDRETVPVAAGDARLTFAASAQVPGEVVYIHPVHGLAVISYDPALLGDTPVRSAEFAPKPLEPGDRVWLVGLDERHSLVSVKTRVARSAAVRLPLTDPPRFRETNLELLYLAAGAPTVGGVLADAKGRVGAFWAAFSKQGRTEPESFFAGIPAARVLDIADPLSRGEAVGWRALGAELHPIPLADARARGLSDAAAARIVDADGHRLQLLAVGRLTAGTDAARVLQQGDLLLAIDGEPAPSLDAVERAAQAERVQLEVLRDGEELRLALATAPLDGTATDRFLSWAGALLHEPHRALAAQKGVSREGVYVAWFWYGSPGNRYGLRATHRIVAVDGTPTPDLDAFLAAVGGRRDRQAVRLRTLDVEGIADVVTLKLDLEYWPTVEFRRGRDGWERLVH